MITDPEKRVDFKFGLNNCVLPIMKELEENSDDLPNNWYMKTTVFYNGRERGVCLITYRFPIFGITQHIFFAEYRSSDDIVVYSWTTDTYDPNPPKSLPEDCVRKFFKVGDFDGAAEYIWNLQNDHITQREFEIEAEMERKFKNEQ